MTYEYYCLYFIFNLKKLKRQLRMLPVCLALFTNIAPPLGRAQAVPIYKEGENDFAVALLHTLVVSQRKLTLSFLS